jgi:hypothetical protein
LSKKQTRKFSRIFLLKKALKINKFYENFEFVFKRIVFSKNPFVFMDFLEFSYRKNPLDFEKILSKFINFFESPAINFIFKSLVLWNQIKKGNNFTYKIIFEILANLKIKKLIEIDPSVLKKIVGLVEEWILKLKNLIELSKNNIL